MNRSAQRFAAGPLPALAVAGLCLVLAACTVAPGASAASPGPTSAVPVGSSSLPPSQSPGAVGGGRGVTPIPLPGGPGASGPPGDGIPIASPTEVQPVANLLEVHDVKAESVSADGAAAPVRATVTWWSGPAPCSALSEVKVDRSGNAFTLTVREGAQQLGIACPALAMHKQATVELGALPAGSYTVTAFGLVTPPVAFAVPG